MEVVVTGRHCDITERYREHCAEKLGKLEKHDHRIMRVHVEVDCEPNPRQHDSSVHLELTAFSKGPVIRAEAAADHQMAALDLALDKMAAQMRRASDRRRNPKGRKQAQPGQPPELPADGAALVSRGAEAPEEPGPVEVVGDGPMVVRHKTHATEAMTLDQALYEMELVGHDFYLFLDAASGRPAVVYRRRGYDYGVISLDLETGSEAGEDTGAVAGSGGSGIAAAAS